jgi:anaerobic selenocysteine-containing dehydrogenase
MFWDQASNELSYWDATQILWKTGVSGRQHYDECVERWQNKTGSTEASPARLPKTVDPALFGRFKVILADGSEVMAEPAFQQLASSVRKWDFKRTEEVTGIPAERIEQSAEMIATIKPIEIHSGVQYMATNTSQFLMAASLLKNLTGCVDTPGGNSFTQFYPVEPSVFPGEWDISYYEGLPLEQKRKRLGYYEHPIGCGAFHDEYWINWLPQRPENADALCNIPDIGAVLKAAETGDPYEVHGIIAISSNWLMHDPGTPRWIKLLEDEEKIQLHVVTEMVMTPTAEMADYVFPATTWMERNYLEFGVAGATPFKNFYRRAIEPRGEARHDYYFGAKLAQELEKLDSNYNNNCLLNPKTSYYFAEERGKLWENLDIDEERDRLCQRFLGKDFETCLNERRVFVPDCTPGAPYQRYLVSGRFPTDTGKINIFSTVHQRYGFSPLPVYTEPLESPVSRPDLAKDYPLVLSTGKRQPGYFHSEFRQMPLTRQLSPAPEAMMSRQTASEYGLKDGDWVWVETPPTNGRELGPHRVIGKLTCRVMMRPGQVTYSQHAWWRPEKSVSQDLHGAFEFNAEVLLDCETCTPETGTLGVRSLLCRVYKCSEEEVASYHPWITREELEALLPKEERPLSAAVYGKEI